MGETFLGGVQEAGQLLPQILPDFGLSPEGVAADQVLEQWFRQHHTGSRERAAMAGLVYHVLRHRRRLEAMIRACLPACTHPDGRQLAIAAAVALREEGAMTGLSALLGGTHGENSDTLPPMSRAEWHSLPDWLWQRFVAQWGETEAESLAECLNQPASVDLRVNRLRASREALLSVLAAARIGAGPTPYAPTGVRLTHRQPLGALACFREGWFEIQDEGSQLIAPLLAPRAGETVVDLCAGSGGKTLHLAALMQNRGRIVAADLSAARLARLGGRSRRAGVRIIRQEVLRHERDPKLKGMEGRADAVLVDAPCSGIGTLRRHPEIKWLLQSGQVEAYHYRQCALLEAGARLTRPGGRLLYVTCSLLQRENQAVAAAFLADNKNFRVRPVPAITGGGWQEGLILLPHQTKTDGFFAVLFERTA